jgi:hypothetical protein
MVDRRLVGGNGYRGLDGDRRSATLSIETLSRSLTLDRAVHSNSHGFAATHGYFVGSAKSRARVARNGHAADDRYAAGKAYLLAVFPDINSEFSLPNANRRWLCATINNNQKTEWGAAMRQFMMTVLALTAFGAMVATAKADHLGGAPVRNGDQCFRYSGGGSRP